VIRVGLTGSIGMGKSTTAALFAEQGVPIWDADAAVHRLYGKEGAAVAAVGAEFPDAIVEGAVDRSRLSHYLLGDPAAFGRLEAIVHPLVAADRQTFLDQARADGAKVVVLDIPLLFETGGEAAVDAVVVVTAAPDQQRDRVLARPGMTADRFEAILGRQIPDDDKRSRAHFVIDTSSGLDAAKAQVIEVLSALADRADGAQTG
jgi:dephospho-CoA kinase